MTARISVLSMFLFLTLKKIRPITACTLTSCQTLRAITRRCSTFVPLNDETLSTKQCDAIIAISVVRRALISIAAHIFIYRDIFYILIYAFFFERDENTGGWQTRKRGEPNLTCEEKSTSVSRRDLETQKIYIWYMCESVTHSVRDTRRVVLLQQIAKLSLINLFR